MGLERSRAIVRPRVAAVADIDHGRFAQGLGAGEDVSRGIRDLQ